ncbi:hypothetical protein AB0E63_12735 [Kribbella sp. NPDC026596]|uniref:hypothetical protein n=1 Tax=Kribbella sp. NPDC026596 TaxID=3155122 RepID=UPI003406C4E8
MHPWPSAPWQLSGRGGIDRTNLGHSGANNAYVRDSIGTHQLQQNVAVRPNHRYRLTAWMLYGGFFGHGQDVWLLLDDIALEEI